jgi:hypothetical protein
MIWGAILLAGISVIIWIALIELMYERKAETIQFVTDNGGSIVHCYQADKNGYFFPRALPPPRNTLLNLVGRNPDFMVWGVFLHKKDLSEDDLRLLERFDHLCLLGLERSSVSDANIPSLAVFRDLKFLYLSDTQVTDRSLPYLREMASLEIVRLDGTRVTQEGVDAARKLMPRVKFILDPEEGQDVRILP